MRSINSVLVVGGGIAGLTLATVTRDLVLGETAVPRYSGTTMLRWVVDGVPDVGPEGFYQSEYLVVTLRLRDGRVYLATGRDFPEKPTLDAGAARRMLRENLQTFTAPLMVELANRVTEDTRVIVNDYDWLLAPDPWFRGRVVLIGDAAHATTAHLASGGGMAIEDAVALAQEVEADGPVAGVLGRFMKRRFERVGLVVTTSVEIAELQQAGGSVDQQNALRGRAMAALASPF